MDYSSHIQYFKTLNCRFFKDEYMFRHTSFRIGGPADLFVEVYDLDSLKKILIFLNNNKTKYFLVGNGTNLLVKDEGYRGIILNLKGDFKESKWDGDVLYCGAGTKLLDICKIALSNSMSGLEFAYGIPGSCGGAVFMNAGAYGNEMKDIVLKVVCMDKYGNLHSFSNNECKFSYRNSIFKSNDLIIVSVFILLKRGSYTKIKSRMDNLMSRRINKQPLDLPSAGSFFKRPSSGYASEIIEKCGLKGMQIGNAAVSHKHAGFIVNFGGATFDDVKKLQFKITSQVADKTGILLEPEVLEI